MHEDKDLEIFSPDSSIVEISGERIEVKPITIGKIKPFAAAVRPIYGNVMSFINGGGDFLEIIERDYDNLLTACMTATGVSRERLESATLDEFTLLVATVLRINADFFVHKLLPTLKGAMSGLQQQVEILKTSTPG